jgi:hypothetical protein
MRFIVLPRLPEYGRSRQTATSTADGTAVFERALSVQFPVLRAAAMACGV